MWNGNFWVGCACCVGTHPGLTAVPRGQLPGVAALPRLHPHFLTPFPLMFHPSSGWTWTWKVVSLDLNRKSWKLARGMSVFGAQRPTVLARPSADKGCGRAKGAHAGEASRREVLRVGRACEGRGCVYPLCGSVCLGEVCLSTLSQMVNSGCSVCSERRAGLGSGGVVPRAAVAAAAPAAPAAVSCFADLTDTIVHNQSFCNTDHSTRVTHAALGVPAGADARLSGVDTVEVPLRRTTVPVDWGAAEKACEEGKKERREEPRETASTRPRRRAGELSIAAGSSPVLSFDRTAAAAAAIARSAPGGFPCCGMASSLHITSFTTHRQHSHRPAGALLRAVLSSRRRCSPADAGWRPGSVRLSGGVMGGQRTMVKKEGESEEKAEKVVVDVEANKKFLYETFPKFEVGGCPLPCPSFARNLLTGIVESSGFIRVCATASSTVRLRPVCAVHSGDARRCTAESTADADAAALDGRAGALPRAEGAAAKAQHSRGGHWEADDLHHVDLQGDGDNAQGSVRLPCLPALLCAASAVCSSSVFLPRHLRRVSCSCSRARPRSAVRCAAVHGGD